MHLVFISTLFNPPWGGSEALWSSAALRALEGGHKVSVFISEREKLEPLLERLKRAGARLHFWKPKYEPLNFFQRVAKKLLGRKLPQWEWWHANLPQDADAICVSQGGVCCALKFHGLVEAVASSGSPYVLLARCDTGIEFFNDETRSQLKSLIENAAAFVAASQSTIDQVKLYLPSKLPNAQVLHSPLADYAAAEPPIADGGEIMADSATGAKALDARRSTLDSKAPEVLMACVGRLHVSDKGQHLLLACLAEKTWRSRPFRLSFFGEGPDRKYLEELVEFYGLGEKVCFAGHTSNVAGIWQRAHLAVQPSFVEGAPQSLLEAMLCRRPCVATAVSGIPEWVEEGKTGFLAEAPTVYHLRLALERAWENRPRWAEMGEAARAACLAKRDPDPAGTLLALLRKAGMEKQKR